MSNVLISIGGKTIKVTKKVFKKALQPTHKLAKLLGL